VLGCEYREGTFVYKAPSVNVTTAQHAGPTAAAPVHRPDLADALPGLSPFLLWESAQYRITGSPPSRTSPSTWATRSSRPSRRAPTSSAMRTPLGGSERSRALPPWSPPFRTPLQTSSAKNLDSCAPIPTETIGTLPPCMRSFSGHPWITRRPGSCDADRRVQPRGVRRHDRAGPRPRRVLHNRPLSTATSAHQRFLKPGFPF